MKFVWSAVLALSVASSAFGDDDDAKTPARTYTAAEFEAMRDLANRVLKLEELQQDAELEKLKAAAAREKQDESKGLPDRVSNLEKKLGAAGQTWDASKMLSFATPDGNFTAKVGGRFYFVYRNVLDAPGAGIAAPRDTFTIDTARIQLDGSFYKDFYYRVEFEGKTGTPTLSGSGLAAAANTSINNAIASNVRLNEAYIGWRGLGDWVALQAGLFKTPWSQEETCSSRFIDFAERSLLNRISPGRETQIMLFGSLFEKIVEWNLGIANGNTGREDLKFLNDNNDEKDIYIRLFVTPLRTSSIALLKQLRLGIDYTAGEKDNPTVAVGDISTGDLGLPVLVDFTGGLIQDDSSRVDINFSWLYGPFSLRAEYAKVRSDLIGSLNTSFKVRAWYVQATYLLTGEEKPLENRVKPSVNFDPLGGTWGAFELAARWSVIDGISARHAGIITANGSPNSGAANGQTGATEYTLGVNWWMTPNVAMRLNWERLTYDLDIPTGKNGAFKRYEDCIYMRWQIDF